VPDLADLIRAWLDDVEDATLVLCGHSRGCLVGFAALLRLQATRPDLMARTGFLTTGSQLQVVYSRAFPAYVTYHAIEGLYQALDRRWRNL
jgi:pimeloyl-ACP methyl ester carboxylesterase